MTKTAVILFNLGGPDGPEAVTPFLYNLFRDPAIIRLPPPLRQVVAELIARKRAPITREIYAKLGGCSPIFANTQAQARALEKRLGTDFRCFVAMRYWHPFAEGAARAVKEFAPDEIILLPLYPQFSTTTTASSFKSWERAVRRAGLHAPTRKIDRYPAMPGFIAALAENAREACKGLAAAHNAAPRYLFSAHGLPEKIVRAGDPYPAQCAQTAEALAKELGLKRGDWVLCYQSRVGPLKWIGPATDEEIARAGRDGVPIVIVPIAFVSEHSETLYEIDMLYRALAQKAGVPAFARAQTVGAAPAFIAGLAGLVSGC
ncbi:MAG TPA: ferrochelatase [Alphaproteobacteria bacterium]|nr:ferrochelatase [Alphaproteobacteria bacterium]